MPAPNPNGYINLRVPDGWTKREFQQFIDTVQGQVKPSDAVELARVFIPESIWDEVFKEATPAAQREKLHELCRVHNLRYPSANTIITRRHRRKLAQANYQASLDNDHTGEK